MRVAAIVSMLAGLVLAWGPAQATEPRLSTIRVYNPRTGKISSFVGRHVTLGRPISSLPKRLPHGLGETGNLRKRLPHGLGETGNLRKRLPHPLGRIGRIPTRLPHPLGRIGRIPARLPHPLGPAGSIPKQLGSR